MYKPENRLHYIQMEVAYDFNVNRKIGFNAKHVVIYNTFGVMKNIYTHIPVSLSICTII